MSNTDKVLILRTRNEDLKSHGGFQWPESGPVSCDDWDPAAQCGNGLRGLLWGEGNGLLLDWGDGARWLVVEVAADEVAAIDSEKVKFPRGEVVHCGDQESATEYILAHGAEGKAVVGARITAGYAGTATAGNRGTILISYWDREKQRKRVVVGYVGEDGIEPNKPYCLDDEHRLVLADNKEQGGEDND